MPERITDHRNTESDFAARIGAAVARLPQPEPVRNPYDRQSKFTTPIVTPFDYQFSADGFVKFGPAFDVRRVMMNDSEVVYAHNPKKPQLSAFLINHFADEGGLDQRVWFTGQHEGITKKHEVAPWNNPFFNPMFHRPLEPREIAVLNRAIEEPTEMDVARLTVPSLVELELLAANRQHIIDSENTLREDLKALDKARADGWRSAQETYLL